MSAFINLFVDDANNPLLILFPKYISCLHIFSNAKLSVFEGPLI